MVAAGVGVAVLAGIGGYLIGSLVWSIRKEKRSSRLTKLWVNFGLSMAFCVLFLTSWMGHAITEWQLYAQEQQAHDEPIEVTGYLTEFAQSSLENWQSEFLQLFSFVVLSALFIHRGSGESKDSDERMEQALKRIENELERLSGS